MEFFNKVKAGIQSLAMQFIPNEEKITRLFLGAAPHHVRPIVVMPVTTAFAKKIHGKMRGVKHVGKLWNGTLNGVEVTMVRQEMGAPNTAVMMEALKRANARTVVRVDYCGAIAPEMEVGHLAVPRQAFVGDGTTPHYFPKHSSAVPFDEDHASRPRVQGATNTLQKAILEAAEKLSGGARVFSGPVWTTDALFRETPEKIKYWRSLGVETVDMESSALFYIGAQMNIRVASLLAASDVPGHPEYDFINGTKVHPGIESGANLAVKVLAEALPQIRYL
ncbi:MAG: phosphorylase family protein [Promethearchaeota archaeon]